MNISRIFLITGALWLLVGISLGMWMGAHQDFTLAPVHAHINLLGFTLMTIFGIAYRVIPGLADTAFAKAHFWLHEVGVLVTLICLPLVIQGNHGLEPVLAAAEGVIFLGIIAWTINVIRKVA